MTKRGSSHKPSPASSSFRIYGTNPDRLESLSDPTRPRRSKDAEAHHEALKSDIRRSLERLVRDVQEASR